MIQAKGTVNRKTCPRNGPRPNAKNWSRQVDAIDVFLHQVARRPRCNSQSTTDKHSSGLSRTAVRAGRFSLQIFPWIVPAGIDKEKPPHGAAPDGQLRVV